MAKRGPQPKFDKEKKWCNRCKAWLPLDDFGDNKSTASGKAYYCKVCHNLYCRRFWTTVQAYEHILMRDYKLTPQGYLAFWNIQGKKCAVCAGELTLYNRATCVDYDSATGRTRGLLCADCYAGIGKLKNSPELLLKAARYLSPIADPVADLPEAQ